MLHTDFYPVWKGAARLATMQIYYNLQNNGKIMILKQGI